MKKRILFIENQGFDLDIYCKTLEDFYDVDTAFDISQARDYVDDDLIKKYKLIILDIMMPCGDMYELSDTMDGLLTGLNFFEEYLKDQPNKKKPIPVIILTAATDEVIKKIEDFKRKYSEQIKFLENKVNCDPNCLADKVKEILND